MTPIAMVIRSQNMQKSLRFFTFLIQVPVITHTPTPDGEPLLTALVTSFFTFLT